MRKTIKYSLIFAGVLFLLAACGCGNKHYTGYQTPKATPTVKVVIGHQGHNSQATDTPTPTIPSQGGQSGDDSGEGSGFTPIDELFPSSGDKDNTPTPTKKASKTPTPTPKATSKPSNPTPTPVPTPYHPTNTPRPEKTDRPLPTPTDYPDASPTPGTFIVIKLTGTPTVAPTKRPTATPRPTATTTPTPEVKATATPTPTETPTPTPTCTPTALETAQKGDNIEFGHYEQDADTSNGKEPIEWTVLEVSDTEVLLMSTKILYSRFMNQFGENESWYKRWDSSDLSVWLNGTFYGAAFSDEEKKKIMAGIISAPNGNNVSSNKVYLLTEEELCEYLEITDPEAVNDVLKATMTKAAWDTADSPHKPEEYSEEANYYWWLRSYQDDGYTKAVNSDGQIVTDLSWYAYGVRPVIRIKK